MACIAAFHIVKEIKRKKIDVRGRDLIFSFKSEMENKIQNIKTANKRQIKTVNKNCK